MTERRGPKRVIRGNPKTVAVLLELELLREHFEANDPYVDNYPTSRHEAAKHRPTCKYCIAYAAHLKEKAKNAK